VVLGEVNVGGEAPAAASAAEAPMSTGAGAAHAVARRLERIRRTSPTRSRRVPATIPAYRALLNGVDEPGTVLLRRAIAADT
jgi:hypothetical protein